MLLLLIKIMYNSHVIFTHASIVKWISRRSSEPLLGVRIPLDAQNISYCNFYKRHKIKENSNFCPFIYTKTLKNVDFCG